MILFHLRNMIVILHFSFKYEIPRTKKMMTTYRVWHSEGRKEAVSFVLHKTSIRVAAERKGLTLYPRTFPFWEHELKYLAIINRC